MIRLIPDNKYIADSSSLITLISSKSSRGRPRDLGRLLRQGRLKVPDAVKRELDNQKDRLADWLRRNPDCVQRSTDENTVDVARIATQHRGLIGDKPGAADPVVVAMGIYYRAAGWTVLTDDGGVQAACYLEGVRFLTVGAFSALERI